MLFLCSFTNSLFIVSTFLQSPNLSNILSPYTNHFQIMYKWQCQYCRRHFTLIITWHSVFSLLNVYIDGSSIAEYKRIRGYPVCAHTNPAPLNHKPSVFKRRLDPPMSFSSMFYMCYMINVICIVSYFCLCEQKEFPWFGQ